MTESKELENNTSEDEKNISAKRIRERRNELKITRKVLASKVGISTQILNNIENSRTKLSSLRDTEIERMAFQFKCTKDFILGKSDGPNKLEDGSIVPIMFDPDFISTEKMNKAIEEFPEGFRLLYEANFILSPNEKEILIKILKALLNDYESGDVFE